MTQQIQAPEIIQLDWKQQGGAVVVTPENQDRYVIRFQRAIELLDMAGKHELFKKQFQLLINTIGQWKTTRGEVRDAYVTLRDGAVSLVVVRNKLAYDAEFEDALSDLDIAIANDKDLDLIRFCTLALPPVSEVALSQFLDPSFAVKL